LIDRRTFLAAALALLAWPFRGPARAADAAQTRDDLRRLLEQSPYVYVSPLRSDGRESTCHGEVWFAWIDGAVVVITGSERWKAHSLEAGLDRARIWVGDHGRWKQLVGHSDAFRVAPSFEARASAVRDDALLDRLLASFEEKYPDEIEKWRDRMRRGYGDGSRVLIRYVPTEISSRLPGRSART
jgi:hypothetical protein